MTKFPLAFLIASLLLAQDPESGRRQFENRCAGCHGGDGNGGELGPAIVRRLSSHDDRELATIVRQGFPTRGMPAFRLSDTEMSELIAFARTLTQTPKSETIRGKVETTDGRTLEGVILNQSSEDMQLQTADHRIHLLRKVGERYRPVTSQTDWPSYNGQLSGNRYSKLDQINKTNVGRLAPKWVFSLPNTAPLQVTPVVVDGIMYVTSANESYALDAGSGRQIWHYQRPRTRSLIGNAAGGINRGVAQAGDRIFMVTDHAHIISLNRFTGELLWETEMADWHLNYNATSAPLAVGNLVDLGLRWRR